MNCPKCGKKICVFGIGFTPLTLYEIWLAKIKCKTAILSIEPKSTRYKLLNEIEELKEYYSENICNCKNEQRAEK